MGVDSVGVLTVHLVNCALCNIRKGFVHAWKRARVVSKCESSQAWRLSCPVLISCVLPWDEHTELQEASFRFCCCPALIFNIFLRSCYSPPTCPYASPGYIFFNPALSNHRLLKLNDPGLTLNCLLCIKSFTLVKSILLPFFSFSLLLLFLLLRKCVTYLSIANKRQMKLKTFYTVLACIFQGFLFQKTDSSASFYFPRNSGYCWSKSPSLQWIDEILSWFLSYRCCWALCSPPLLCLHWLPNVSLRFRNNLKWSKLLQCGSRSFFDSVSVTNSFQYLPLNTKVLFSRRKTFCLWIVCLFFRWTFCWRSIWYRVMCWRQSAVWGNWKSHTFTMSWSMRYWRIRLLWHSLISLLSK